MMKPVHLVLAGLAALAMLGGSVQAATGPAPRFEPANLDPHDVASLQRGAKLFVNYCLNCHSAKYMRYNRLTDLGLTEAQIAENLIFTGTFEEGDEGSLQFQPTKVGQTMEIAARARDTKAWFGVPPPDLSVISRVRGTDWLYNYMLGFYRDPGSATGWNNLVFENVGMPHALWELSGTNRLVTTEFPTHEAAEGAAIGARGLALVAPAPGHKYVVKTLEVDAPGTMSPADYRRAVGDLVNFLDYMGEPDKVTRQRMGLVVLLYLFVLLGVAYWLKRAYWKDLH